MGDKVLIARGVKDPDIVAEGRWARWTGAALRRPGRTLTIGLVLLGALIVPAFGMKLGMPGARVVDPGHTSRDGYDLVVESFGPGAAGPAYVTVDAADAQQVIDVAMATDNVVDARIVAPPADTGRVVVRVVPGTQIDESATADMVEASEPARHGRAERRGRRTGGPEPRPHQRARRPCPLRHRDHPDRGVPAAARGVPQRRDRHVLDPHEPRHRRRRVRVRHPRVPARLRAALIGIEHQGFVDAWAPLFFFALLFGLSMDYQLFLLAAIKERYQATGDTHRAIAKASPAPAGRSPTRRSS